MAESGADNNSPLMGKGATCVVDGAVPEEILERLLKVAPHLAWTFGWSTSSNPQSRYWHHEIGHGSKSNKDSVLNKVSEHPLPIFGIYLQWLTSLLPDEVKVIRMYMNGHTFGTEGWPHLDSDNDNESTFILYIVDQWDPAWSGETIIFDGANNITDSVMPARNRLLQFPSNRLHTPRPVSRAFYGLRMVLVTKVAWS